MKDRYMEFRRARREEAEEILQLYRSLIGTEYCVWTENYPTEREVEFDLSRNALFCLYEKMPEPDEREQGATPKPKNISKAAYPITKYLALTGNGIGNTNI